MPIKDHMHKIHMKQQQHPQLHMQSQYQHIRHESSKTAPTKSLFIQHEIFPNGSNLNEMEENRKSTSNLLSTNSSARYLQSSPTTQQPLQTLHNVSKSLNLPPIISPKPKK